MRRFLSDALAACGVEVVASVGDGRQALEACARLRPNVMTLDMQMPGLSGTDVLRRMPAGGPGVIIVSAHTPEGSALAVEALSIGAADVVGKPGVETSMSRFAADLGASVQAAASTQRQRGAAPQTPTRRVERRAPRLTRPLVLIASSTGGPRALADLVPRLPNPCGAGVVIVQHMPAGFTDSLARRLDALSALNVREAVDGDRIEPGVALLAPGGSHLRLRGTSISLTREDAIGGLRPRADLTIEDAARDWKDRCALVVLTGMGNDATRGARLLKGAGGVVLSEAAESCVVYGMPRSIEEAGLADVVEPLAKLADALSAVIR
jgi:two-component system, chemotaxis family, protein-glutamate methylesterase/glutaminase